MDETDPEPRSPLERDSRHAADTDRHPEPAADTDRHPGPATDRERGEILETLGMQRHFLRYTLHDLNEEQITAYPTASDLCLGGILKHVAHTEGRWMRFVVEGTGAMAEEGEAAARDHELSFTVLRDETAQVLLDRYEEVARATEEIVRSLPSLDVSHALPPAPWFAPGAHWSARRVLLHLIAETSQHAGHADIIRESIDGQKTMG